MQKYKDIVTMNEIHQPVRWKKKIAKVELMQYQLEGRNIRRNITDVCLYTVSEKINTNG